MAMARIGVTGAFGFLGANFMKALLEEGDELGFPAGSTRIVAFASKTRDNPLLDKPGLRARFRESVSVESLDILDREDMARKFAGLDAVVHFAGLVDYRLSMKRRVWDTDVLGAKAVFDAALAAGLQKVLYVSSICVLGSGFGTGATGAERFCDEESPSYGDPRWPVSFASPEEALAAVEASLEGDYRFLDRSRIAYFDAKLAGWELAKQYARERGLPVVTVFPGTAVGAGDIHHAITTLVDLVWEGKLRLSFNGATSFVTARDFAKGAVLALGKGRIGEGYILSGREEHNLSYVEFQDLVASLARAEQWFAQRRPPVLPVSFLLALATLAESILPGTHLTRAFVLSGNLLSLPCSSAKACAELGYAPSSSIVPAIVECRRFAEAGWGKAKRPWILPLARHVAPFSFR
jgi:dihydroflavonol-4-reductase